MEERTPAPTRTPSPSAISVAHDSEEGRAFLQERLALSGRIGATISFLFWVLRATLVALFQPRALATALLSGSSLWHLGESLVLAVVWLVCRRGRWSTRALHAVDAVALVSLSLCFGLMGFSEGVLRPQKLGDALVVPNPMAMVTATLLLVLARAIVVPSTPRRTAAVSLGAAVPMLVVTYLVCAWSPIPALHRVATSATLYVGIWQLAMVALSTVASAVVYRLHARAVAAEQLGQYQLEAKIGEGGMGTVYRARHAMLRRPTAIKLLPAEKAGEHAVARFEREVQLTARLTHQNTIAIYDYGRTPEGVFYYAMELIDGVDLDALVRRAGPMPPARAIHVLAQICDALDEAHSMGLVHRDVKPANVLLCERGRSVDVVKVCDFGLVKETVAEGGGDLSAANVIVGTPLYLAPEAITTPSAIDGSADLYAVGCVAYWLLTGTEPFSGSTLVEICAHHLHSVPEPPSQRLGAPIPPDLERLVLSCLAKKREERPESAAALASALRACDVPRWTNDEGRAWWASTGAQLRHRDEAPVEAALAHTVAVDLASRGE